MGENEHGDVDLGEEDLERLLIGRLIRDNRAVFQLLDGKSRIGVVEKIMEGWCRVCGNTLPCNCWRDE